MSKHVLLIDDDRDDAEIFSDALSELQLDVILDHFDDGRQALGALVNAPPQIIFLDINMPSINGWDCLREIKNLASFQNIPIVMYSTANLNKTGLTPKDVGASAFLTKPSDFIELKRQLSDLFSDLL